MRITHILCLALLGIAVGGCDAPAPRSILSRQCVPVGSEPTNLAIRAPAHGTVRVGVEPRGIAVVASVPGRSGTPVRATSPVDRLGLITLVAPAHAGETIAVRIESRDWHEIRAEVCVDAVLLPRSDVERTRAERAFSRAGAATHERDWQRAFDSYDAAARGFARLGLNELSGAARHAMGELAYMRLHRESEAIELVSEARRAYGPDLAPVTRGTLAALETRAEMEVRNLSDASEIQAVQRIIDISRDLLSTSPHGAREALRLTVLEGFLAYRADSSDRAKHLFGEALQACRAAKDWECHGTAAQNLGQLAEEGQNFQASLEVYESALRFLSPTVAPEQTADVWDNLGRLQRVVGLVSLSERSHATALRLYADLKDCDSVRRTLARVGTLHAQIGSLDDAILELQNAASLACEPLFGSLDVRGDTNATGNRAPTVCSRLLDPGALSADGKSAVLQALLALKETSVLSGDPDGAQRCVAQADQYASTSRGKIRTANARGEVLLERQKAAEARLAFEDAERVADAAGFPPAYEHRGRTLLGRARAGLLAGDPKQARRIALQALRASSNRGDVAQSVESLQILAASYRALHHEELASRTLHVAAGLIERVPIDELDGDVRATYLAAQHAVFADLVDLLAASAETEAEVWNAFSTAERGRARSFRYAVSQAAAQRSTSDKSAVDAPYQDLLQQVSVASSDADSDEPSDLVRRLDELEFATAGSFAELDRRALSDRLRRLNSILVQYAVGAHQMFAFVVDPRHIRIVPLGDRDVIAGTADRLAEELRDRETPVANVHATARELARLVWWPVAPFIREKRVIVAPDDALHLVPFSVLPWSATSDLEMVVHRVETTVVPSALFVTLAAHGTRSPRPASGFALVGDPVFRTAQWREECATGADRLAFRSRAAVTPSAWTEWLPSLPASRDEVLAIVTLARQARPESRVETLLGCAATQSTVRQAARQRDTVVHIATHGRIDARRPRLSALALTPEADQPHDTSFSLLDILDLDLDARLVTLSACDTSRGRLLPGEGVLGPAQAFLQAGAATVVASYWRVADDTTARFMNAFYKRLLDQNMSAGEALRLTQVEEQTASGSYSWAAFGLYGRPDTRI